jgi:hypothetical protein
LINTLRFSADLDDELEQQIAQVGARWDVAVAHRLLVALEAFREDLANGIVSMSDAEWRRRLTTLHSATLAARSVVLTVAN